MKTLIRNGNIATVHDFYKGDILIEDGVFKRIGNSIRERVDLEINAAGKVVIPGGIDVHTHFNLHTSNGIARDDFYTGTVAAACGGTTTIIDHMGFGPAGCSLDHQLQVYHEYAQGNAVVDYSFHGVVQHVTASILEQLEDMVKNQGIPSFKLYMTYDFKLSDTDILKLLESIKQHGGLAAGHAENHEIITYLTEHLLKQKCTAPEYHAISRPDYCEGEAVNRLISLAAAAGDAPLYFVHLSTEAGLEHIRKARKVGKTVFAETCPQYLLLDDACYKQEDGIKYILSPPLRKRADQEALWQGIREGSIQVVATDHCTFTLSEDKQRGREDFSQCPNGLPGVEERMPLMFSEGVMRNKISIKKLVEVCCTNPAKLFGLYPQKGTILPGSDADLVIIDPQKKLTLNQSLLHSCCDYTPYEGMKLLGYPIMTLSRGEIIMKDNEFLGSKGRGVFLGRNPFKYNFI